MVKRTTYQVATLQQNLQAIMMQKQQLEAESIEIEKATEELKKSEENEAVYKSVGPLLIKHKKMKH